MDASALLDTSLSAVAARIRRREVSPVELARAALERIEGPGAELRAFATTLPERALERAEEAERALERGEWRGPLHGIPVSVKDLFDVRGTRTTAGSALFRDREPASGDATVVGRLERAGAVLVGKTNLHELAFGTTSTSTIFGPVQNPWKRGRIAGGSSGGSAAAVAAGLGLASLGTDTGGSIRIPAALCGVVGLKPTFGRVSRTGLLPLAPSLDHVGPLARSAEDAAVVLQAIAGADLSDPQASREPVPDYAASLELELDGVRIGALEPSPAEATPEVGAAFREALIVLEKAGAAVDTVRLETQAATREAARVVLFAESAHTYREALAERPEALFPDIRERLERGAAIPAVDYIEALRVRERVRPVVSELFGRFDILVSPMLPITATPPDVPVVEVGGEELPVPVAATTHTREWNLLGNPAMSLPAGFDGEGLPLAVQVVGRPWAELLVLRVGAAYQRRTAWHEQRPPQSE